MTSLIRWEPVDDLLSLREAMNRLFEESFFRARSGLPTPFEGAPALDVYETGDAVVVEAALPGVKPDEIDVTITGDVLTIKGETKEDTKVEKENYIRRERRYGSFCRTVRLPGDLDTDNATAEYKDGILKLTVPKKEEAKTKVIEVKAGEQKE